MEPKKLTTQLDSDGNSKRSSNGTSQRLLNGRCGQLWNSTPEHAEGYYNIERMLKAVVQKGGKIKACGTCADARGIKELELIEGVAISNMAELAKWTVEADKVLTF